MEVESLVDVVNQQLYDSVTASLKIELEENQDWRAEVWDSKIVGDTATIKYCSTSFPKAAFAHQLLCIDTQRKGFKSVLDGLSLDSKVQEQMPTILKTLSYNFQQHKLAKEFFLMGYTGQQIYGDPEDSEVKFLEEQLEGSKRSIVSLSLLYMLLLEPFMGFEEKEKVALKKKFYNYGGGTFKQRLKRIDAIITAWENDESYEAEKYWIDFSVNAGILDTWFSYKGGLSSLYENEFPNGGFFVEKKFSYSEVLDKL